MSGGSMDYICYRVEEAASMCEDTELAELLRDAANVLHDEEWWRSCDYSEDTYRKTLAEFKAKWFKGNRAERLKCYVDKEIEQCRKRCYSIIGPVTADDTCAEHMPFYTNDEIVEEMRAINDEWAQERTCHTTDTNIRMLPNETLPCVRFDCCGFETVKTRAMNYCPNCGTRVVS